MRNILLAVAATALIAAAPRGASVGQSGQWTIVAAHDSPAGPRVARQGGTEQSYYAELAGVGEQEAAKRLREQEQARPEFERLLARLRASEAGNFTDAEMIHRPDWAFLIYFKREPTATLARYTANPRFLARAARYTRDELERLSKPWIERLNGARMTTGYAMNARRGTADIDLVVSREEYDAIARKRGWPSVPDFLNLRFSDSPVGEAVAPEVQTGVRIFPQDDRNLGATNLAALTGRIILRDGCFLVAGHDGKEQLAYFAREVGLGLDAEGYLALHRRNADRTHLGRIGEDFTWGGPIGSSEAMPMVAELRRRCGNAPLLHVGVPESSAMFNARYGLKPLASQRPQAVRPTGATIGKSGFATIRRAPASPTADVKSTRPTYNGPVEWYAHEEGLSVEEAGKRLSEQQAIRPILERLEQRLRAQEPGNYVSARMNHRPDWSYTLFFKRDPEATLRRYSVNPRFHAAKASTTEAELKVLAAPWLERLGAEGIADAYGMDPVAGTVSITIPITAAAFREIAQRNGWEEVPPPLRLHSAQDHDVPRVDPRIAPLLRGFASESLATTRQMERGEGGRVILDDGCLRLATKDGRQGPLVVFHRETGIGLDAQNYLAAIDRRTGKATGRIGEMWSWAGPNPGTQFDGLDELKAVCGAGPVVNVGNPESEARFEARNRRN